MNKLLSGLVFTILILGVSSGLSAGTGVPFPELGDGNGCSALSSPDIDCTDIFGGDAFCGTMGLKGIEVRENDSNDTDLDGESDGIEACICDALDDNPNINMNPGDGSICDSSNDNDRDQFNGVLSMGSKLQGNKYEFCYDFNQSPPLCNQGE